uniref:Uncharacterized protein n=1 Tax=Lepeophtheirus salmonis TaxID=72036 RepID=A0A0K2VJE4_LEPSM
MERKNDLIIFLNLFESNNAHIRTFSGCAKKEFVFNEVNVTFISSELRCWLA